MRVEAWEDENGDSYVSGTEDPKVATKVLREYYDLNIPEESPCQVRIEEDTRIEWWNPSAFQEEVEWVSPENISAERVEDWVPVFRTCLW